VAGICGPLIGTINGLTLNSTIRTKSIAGAGQKILPSGETAHVLAMLPDDQAHPLIKLNCERVDDSATRRPGRSLVIDVPLKSVSRPTSLNVTYVGMTT
jgi:hypothetical protein